QIIRPARPSGSTRNVSGSGMATMAGSSIAVQAVIDEPSKPMPSSSAPSTSPTVIEKLFKCPSRSVNQRSMSSTPVFLICSRTCFRASGSDVARFLLSTCAITAPPRSLDLPGAYRGQRQRSAPGGLLNERPLLQRLPPIAACRVPVHRFLHSVLERDVRFPPELAPQLRGVEQVAAVVAGPVGHDRLQRLRLAGQLEHGVGDLRDRLLDAAADVVRLADAAALQDELDRAAVVAHVQPLALVLRRRVQRQVEIVER